MCRRLLKGEERCLYQSLHWEEHRNSVYFWRHTGLELILNTLYISLVDLRKGLISTIDYLSIGLMRRSKRHLLRRTCSISSMSSHSTLQLSKLINQWYVLLHLVCCMEDIPYRSSKNGQATKRMLLLSQVTANQGQ